jgi:hypothetical protein
MAEPIYDEDKDLDTLNPGELRSLEQQYGTSTDEAEDSAVEDGGNPETMPNKAMGRNLRARNEQKENEEQEALNERVRGGWDKAKKADETPVHENQVGKGYTGKAKDKGRFSVLGNRRNLLIGGGMATGIISIVLLLFNFLNFYKLDGLVSNIDAKTFARLNGSLNKRSSKYITTYMKLRLADIGDDPKDIDTDNLIFRSNKVDTNQPIHDWYKTLRTSSFEQDVFNKSGVKFTSVAYRDGNQIKFRPAKITLDGKDYTGKPIPSSTQNDLRDAINNGDWTKINIDDFGSKYLQIDTFDGDKTARKDIKKVVNDNTQFYQAFQRRHLRKSIQNMTGVRDWRFFENTRDKVDEKKINIRNKLVTKAIPQSTMSGKFVRCLFGITDCRFSEDPSDPQYRSDASLAGDSNPDKEGDAIKQNDPNAPPKFVDMGPAADLVKKVIANANPAFEALNVISTMDSITRVDKAMANHDLSKGVAVARGVQTMGLYQVIKTSRDQVKSGEVNGTEYNALMQTLGPIAAGEGWTKVVQGSGDPSKLTNTAESKKYCSKDNQAAIENNPITGNKEFAYLCPGKQIGGSSNAATLENTYNDSIGPTIHSIASAYSSVRNAPLIGDALGFLNGIFDQFSSLLTGILQNVLALVGLKDDLQTAMGWLVGKLVAFMGAGPILNGNESAGVMVNWLVQGGAYTAEATSRALGGAVTTAASKLTAQDSVIAYQNEQNANMSTFGRYLSLSNPDSPAAKTTLVVSQMSFSSALAKLTDLGSIPKSIGSAIMMPFNSKASAARSHAYDGTDFAGIISYDTNPHCYDLDPQTMTPKDVTNIQQVLGADKVPNADITWDLVRNGDDWYQYIYDKLGNQANADKVAETIYNCQLEDNAVMGSMGANYGYTDDGGLNDSSPDDTASTPTVNATGGAAEIAHKILDAANAGHIKFNTLNSADESDGSSPQKNIQETADGKEANTSTRCTTNAAPNKTAPIDIDLLKFILELSQATDIEINELTGGCHSTSNSSHYQGKAVDFDCPFDSAKADKIGKKYNISDKTGETCSTAPPHYHYSTGGM